MSVPSVSTLGFSALLFAATAAFAQFNPSPDDTPWAIQTPVYDAGSRSAWDDVDSNPALAPPQADEGSPAGTISVHQLKHKIPKKAAKEFDKATNLRNKGRIEAAVPHFQAAVKIDPEFINARNNLAAMYLLRDKPNLAADQLEAAIKTAPHGGILYSNLALSYIMMNRLQDAERAARQALDFDRTSGMRPTMILGMVLVMQNKFTDEASRLLDSAKVEFPQAYLMRARLLAARGQLSEAQSQLQAFIKKDHSDAGARHVAEEWIQTISDARRKSASLR